MALVKGQPKPDSAEHNPDDDFELPVNPEIEQKIAEFKKARPRLARTVAGMSRERLENAYVLERMERYERMQVWQKRVIEAMERPENQDLKKQIESKLIHILDPKVKTRMYERRAVQAAQIGSVKL